MQRQRKKRKRMLQYIMITLFLFLLKILMSYLTFLATSLLVTKLPGYSPSTRSGFDATAWQHHRALVVAPLKTMQGHQWSHQSDFSWCKKWRKEKNGKKSYSKSLWNSVTISKRSFHCKSLGLGYYPTLSQMFRSNGFLSFKQKNR